MKLVRASLVLCIVATTSVTACERSEPAAHDKPAVAVVPAAPDPWAAKPAAAKDPLPHPLLWSAQKDGKTSYLLGTMHMGVDADRRMPDVVWKDLAAEPAFAMETDLGEVSPSAMQRSDGSTLHAELGPVYWKKLQDLATPPVAKAVDNQKPMVAASLLSMRGLPQTAPMDELFLARAQNSNKKVVYLEPAAKQLALLDKWLDTRALKEMLDDAADNDARAKETLDAYVAGDEAKMLALSDAERADFKKAGHTDAEYDQQMNDLLYERNASWIAGIEQMHAAGGAFIAVGAMHLIGPKSVLELLGQRGYKINRVSP